MVYVRVDSLAKDLLKATCLLALLDAADWDQGVLCLHQVVLWRERERNEMDGGRERERERQE